MSFTEKLKNSVMPSLYAAGGSVLIHGGLMGFSELTNIIPVRNLELPAGLLTALSSFTGNIASEMVVEFILPSVMKQSADAIRLEQSYIPPILDGLSVYAVMKSFVSSNTSFTNAMIIGGGGSVLGKYVYNSYGGGEKLDKSPLNN